MTVDARSGEGGSAEKLDGALLAALTSALPELSESERALLAEFLSRTTVEPGGLASREGDHERDLMVVVRGEARITRSGAAIDEIGPGDRIGELSFVTAMPRPVSMIALSRLDLARLSFERYRVLCETHASLGLSLFEALVAGLSRHLPRGGTLAPVVRGRSLPRAGHVNVMIHGIARAVAVGTSVRHLLPEHMQGRRVVAALLDQKGVSLTTPVTSACTVAALTTEHWEGQRVLRDSLSLLALEAGHRLHPPVRLQTGPSIGFAQRITYADPAGRDAATLARDLERAMYDLVQRRLDLREELWTVDEAREHYSERGSPVAALLRTWRDPAVALVSFGEIYALQMGPILPETGLLGGFHVLAGEDVLLLAYGTEGAAPPLASSMFPIPPIGPSAVSGTDATVPLPLVDLDVEYIERQAKRASAHVASLVVDQQRWLAALDVTSVGALNDACINGGVAQLIRVSEGLHEKRIGQIADEIKARGERARVVCIAGPSSSGKTTFIRRLEVQLQVNGLQPVGLSLDDYYVDRVRTPRDEKGEYDYEALEALRLDLLDEHLNRLLAGQTVKTALYAFEQGVSSPEGGRELRLGEGQVLLLEGIHGLNPKLFHTVPEQRVYRLFCCPLAQLPFDVLTRVHASDVRLIRRIVRDRHSRGATAADTIQRWPSVRAGERRHIFPFQHHADAVFDSSLVYELNVLSVFAERYLLEVPQEHPAYTTAFRLMRLLDRFVTIYPDHVPPTSIAREFIGGSGFRY